VKEEHFMPSQQHAATGAIVMIYIPALGGRLAVNVRFTQEEKARLTH
jgi:hypothetical protein